MSLLLFWNGPSLAIVGGGNPVGSVGTSPGNPTASLGAVTGSLCPYASFLASGMPRARKL